MKRLDKQDQYSEKLKAFKCVSIFCFHSKNFHLVTRIPHNLKALSFAPTIWWRVSAQLAGRFLYEKFPYCQAAFIIFESFHTCLAKLRHSEHMWSRETAELRSNFSHSFSGGRMHQRRDQRLCSDEIKYGGKWGSKRKYLMFAERWDWQCNAVG